MKILNPIRGALLVLTLSVTSTADDRVWGNFTSLVLQSGSRNNSKWWANTNINPSPVDGINGHINENFRTLTGTPPGPVDAVVWSPTPLNVASPGRYFVLRFDLVATGSDPIEMSFEYESSGGVIGDPPGTPKRKRWWNVTPNLGMQTIILDLAAPNTDPPVGSPLTKNLAFSGYESWGPYSLVQFFLRTGWWWDPSNDRQQLGVTNNHCNIDLIAFVDDYTPYVPYPVTAYADYFVALHQRELTNESDVWRFYPDNAPTVQYPGDLYLTADKKEVISSLYPRIGTYDTFDPDTAEYQVLTAKSAGFSGFMCEWWMPWKLDSNGKPTSSENLTTQTIKSLAAVAQPYGFNIGITWLLGSSFVAGNGYQFATRQEYLDQIKADILYMLHAMFVDQAGPSINNRPLLPSWDLNSADAGTDPTKAWLDTQEVIDLRAAIVAAGLPDPWILAVQRDFHVLDQGIKPAVNGFFSWHTLFKDELLSPPYPWTDYTTRLSEVSFLTDFYANCDLEWANGGIDLFMGSFLPRFDSHKALSWGSGKKIGVPDDDGQTLTNTFDTFNGSREAKLLLATTWNDFAEATAIQPTREYGFRDLDAVGQRLWAFNGWGTYDSALVRLPERLFQARKAIAFLQQAGVSPSDLQPAVDYAHGAAVNIANRQRLSAEAQLTSAETQIKGLKDDLHTHYIDLTWEYFPRPGVEVGDGIVREWPTTATPTEITVDGETGVRLDSTSGWKIGFRSDTSSQPKLQNHKFIGTLTIEYLDANGTERLSVRGDKATTPYQYLAEFPKKNSGKWRQCQMDVVNTDFKHGLSSYDFDVIQDAGGFGGVRKVHLEGVSYHTGPPH